MPMPKRQRKATTAGRTGLDGLTVERPVAMRRRVYDSLRDRILRGRIPPSTRLVEARLAQEIGASRTPVREALHLLEREGLVEAFPRGGYRVRGIAWSEVEEICEIRVLNETLAARWAIERMDETDRAALEENVARSEAALRDDRWDSFAEYDGEFHEILVRASRSPRLLELCQTLRRHMLLYRAESLADPDAVSLALEGHRRIAARIRARDREGVAAAIRRHLEDAKEAVRRSTGGRGRR